MAIFDVKAPHDKKLGGVMPYKIDLISFLADWWQFLVFFGTGVLAFIAGKERQRYRVETIGRDVATLKKDLQDVKRELADMHAQDGAEAIAAARSITELATDVRYLRKATDEFKHALDELRSELRGKADK